ncbi:MAG: type II toxin-antitoxin system VapC family toxin [Prosthecobacter sp.]|jgi:predicted nucleic acid-binding protein
MRRVFADAWFYIALLDPNDAGHAKAVQACADESITGIVTTRWVLMEVANMLSNSKARAGCAAFMRDLDHAEGMRIIPASEELFQRGLALYDERPDKGWSLTDCISFLVMADEHVIEALTGDHHFEQAGFTALLT